MGRYVSGDFEYKFAFGTQGSTLGTILEEVLDSDENYMYRYTGDYGEIIKLYIGNIDELEKSIKEYIGDFKGITDDQWSKWSSNINYKGITEDMCDKNMMKLFLKNIKERDLDYLDLDIEY